MTRTEDQENLICNGSTMGILERQGSLEERAQERKLLVYGCIKRMTQGLYIFILSAK